MTLGARCCKLQDIHIVDQVHAHSLQGDLMKYRGCSCGEGDLQHLTGPEFCLVLDQESGIAFQSAVCISKQATGEVSLLIASVQSQRMPSLDKAVEMSRKMNIYLKETRLCIRQLRFGAQHRLHYITYVNRFKD